MVKALGVAAAFVMLGTSYISPAYAITLDAAVEQCALVAAEEARAEREDEYTYRGYCISATTDYLSTLASSSLSIEAIGTELATYVVQLADLLNDRVCRPESEIPQAIAMTGEASRDPEQAEQIRLIAMTVFDCDFATTASIGSSVLTWHETKSLPASAN